MQTATATSPLKAALTALRRERTAPAILVLMLLSPLTAEVLTGSTPILAFLGNPILALYQIGFYGAGAMLARELVRRRGLSWANILILGMAYGILEEGLVVTSWFNPNWPDILSYGSYGWALGMNWVWAVNLTAFHAIVSITIPILLVEMLFPRIAGQPWLGKTGFRAIIGLLAFTSVLGLVVIAFIFFHAQHYAPPLLPYLSALALAVVLTWLGTHLRLPATRGNNTRPAPRLWTLRLTGFFSMALLLLNVALTNAWLPFPALCGLIGGFLALLGLRVWTWSRRTGWDARHMLALASGLLGFFICFFAPILEISGHVGNKNAHGTIFVAASYLALLIVLARAAGVRHAPEAISPATLAPDSRR